MPFTYAAMLKPFSVAGTSAIFKGNLNDYKKNIEIFRSAIQ